MAVYFDNAASAPPSPTVTKRFVEVLTEHYANPSSLSERGMRADQVIQESRQVIADTLGALPEEIYFTSGGTESDNWAIFGTALGYRREGKHILTSATEHPAVAEPFRRLGEEGYEVEVLPVDERGYVLPETLAAALRPDTILVSIIAANNETGCVQDLEALGKAIRQKAPQALFHVDAVQAYGKMRLPVHRWGIDLLSASGHKFHTPKGLGFLYIKKGKKVQPLLWGGGQQSGKRSGTENAAGAAALAQAAREAYDGLEAHAEQVRAVKETLWNGLQALGGVTLNGPGLAEASPYVLNVGFENIRSETLLHALEARGVLVSAGSACDSHKKRHSATLTAMGLRGDRLEGSVRFSFSRYNTVAEAEECLGVLNEVVPFLRRYNRR